jgi:amino acid adenylation domain-containing protein
MTPVVSSDDVHVRSQQGFRQSAEKSAVHRLFAAQAARTPEAIALTCGDRHWTYRALHARVRRLARRLRGLGVGPDVLVGLCAERSADLVVGLLAILEAGGAYVPLDPAYPHHRLSLMLEDARVPVLVTEQRLRADLPHHGAEVLELDAGWEDQDDSPDGDRPAVQADNLAYVIYTSGSTGRPKGVAVSHRALTNFLLSMRARLGMGEADTLLAVTTLSFDIAALELFLPLIQGARLELAGRDLAGDGTRLARRLEHPDITVLQATPSTWQMLLNAGWAGSPGLTMLCGGEALPRDLAEPLLGKGQALWNLYGPTETTIWSSAGRVDPGAGPVTIGRPIAQTQLYVLDTQLQPVPPGVAGELFIGGTGLARGYLNRPDLTAERFLPDPFGRVPGARMYRTGDLARRRAEGTLECLGRVDHQVKIRGFRIELGEVEAGLRRHPAVRESVVAARAGATGTLELVAYVLLGDGPDPKPGAPELRRHLLDLLPEFMVPSIYVTLDAMPMTPNGKIDRRALPDPDPERSDSVWSYVPPRGPIEEAVVQLWSELLGRSRVGVQDNFFDLGGHSLLATQLVARVRDLFGVEIALREFLDQPSVAGLAQLVERELAAGDGAQAPPILPVPRDGLVPASFAQQRLWFLDQLEPNSPVYNMPVAVRLTGDLDLDALRRVLHEVVRRHEVLRTTFAAVDGLPRQVIAPVLEIDLPLLDLSQQPAEERERQAMHLLDQEARRPFDLARGPLIRAMLLRLEAREHLVLVTMHHIISDAWSLGVLVREVSALYDAFTQGQPSPLPEPSLQYADYAQWQRAWLSGAVLQAQLDYWVERLRGVPALELPTDRRRPSALSGRGDSRVLELPADLVDQVRALGRQDGATLYMTLLAAFQVLLHRYSGQDNFAIGTPIAGRTRSEVEGLVGLFVNTLVLRAELGGDPDFRTLLRRVRQAALAAYSHQDMPFEQIVAVLHPERDPARSPLFQALFAFQNAPMPTLESPGLVMTPLESDSGTAKFDLALFAGESDAGLRLEMQYSTDLFDGATIEQMLRHFQVLLEGMVAGPDQAIGTLPMLSDAEHRDVLGLANASALEIDGLTDDEVDDLLCRIESGLDV